MNKKLWIFILFCGTFWLRKEVKAHTAICDYEYDIHSTFGYKNTSASYYKCNLGTSQANYDEIVTRIDGQHENGQSDDDVEWIENYNDNKLRALTSVFCQKFPNLRVIYMMNVELESIDEDLVLDCENLDHLFLHDNKIRELSENFLIGTSKLTTLSIQNSQLTTLPQNLFLNQKDFYELCLNKNQINFLPSSIFRPLVKLEVLYLYDNKLMSIDPEWFITLQNLKWLRIDGNQISEIPSKSFTSLRHLERLSLNKNRIKTLNSGCFDGLEDLQILSLHINEISDLPVGVFTPLKNLQKLFLQNNKLTTINSNSFGIHNKLTEVYLQDNKINAIDEKFIDNSNIVTLKMAKNICIQINTRKRSEIKSNLKRCLDNYQPRLRPQVIKHPTKQIIQCGKSKNGQGNIIGGTQIKSGDYPW